MSSLIADVEKRLENTLKAQRKSYDATRKLNDIKINMTYMEWYKKVSEGLGGYYDCYKIPKGIAETSSQQEIIKHQRILTKYWKEMVEKADRMPQKEGVNFRTRWLYAGTNCRRMVEPLDIAYYYKQGKRDYINKGRSMHYKLLEQWMEDDKKEAQITNRERNKACSLTEDSCFWAHVEEAIISCKVLKERETRPEQKTLSLNSLSEFETYVMDSIKNLSVSTEIFLEKSSYMKWWREYNEIMGISHNTELAVYMRNPCRRYV